MKVRKKKILDGIDKEILRCLYHRRPLVTNQIAKCVGRTPPAIKPRLINLQKMGLIKPSKVSGIRQFKRIFGTKQVKIKSPRSIYWDLDLKPQKRRK